MTNRTPERREPMSPSFAVFNLHINNAGKLADAEFIRIFDQKRFDRHIAPRQREGIMTIFDRKPNIYTMAWVAMVTVLVNQDPTSEITDELLESYS